MAASISRAHQGFSIRRFIAALVVVVCLSAPVAGASGTAASTGANAGSIGPTESGVYAQTGPLVASNGSVTINETRTNRTQVVLDSVTLPQNGYIVAQTGNVSANQSAGTVVGHTQYVRNGPFKDVILNLNESVREGKTLSVVLYNDTNGDEILNTTGNDTDTPYQTSGGAPVYDTVRLGSEQKTTNRSQNTTSTNATVTLSNQTINGSTVTVQRATLPKGGFLVLHGSGFSTAGVLDSSAIAVSPYLKPGSHTNVTLQVSRSPPGGTLNRTVLNRSGTYGVVAYQDTNNTRRFGFLTSDTDGPYIVGNGTNRTVAADTGRIIINGSRADPTAPEPPSATVTFPNQSTTGSSVTVRSVRLPDGGFVVVHTASYQTSPLSSTIGVSRYLPPGNYQNVSVKLTESVQRNQTLIAIPSRDTNGNKTYDYVRSDGFRDVGYTANGSVVTGRARITTANSAVTALSTTTTQTATERTPAPTTTSGHGLVTGKAAGGGSGGSGLIPRLLTVAAAVVLVVVGIGLIRRP